MIISLLARNEGKTIEFKRNLASPGHVIRTVVAFANTVGGTLVIGVRDRTKEVIGLKNALAEEERLASLVADTVRPQLVPDIQVQAFRNRELIVVKVPHVVGPYYVKAEGPEAGVYVRLGSTNRRAGPETIAEIKRLARNTSFDELPCRESDSEAIDFRVASELFSGASRPVSRAKFRTLGLLVDRHGRQVPTNGAVLLFGKNRGELFPDAVIRCARFKGKDKTRFIDQTEIDEYLPKAVESTVAFIERHTRQAFEIGRLKRQTIPEYPTAVVREAVINAVVHADYSIGGSCTQVAVFDTRIEITNPGFLPFGLTLEAALAGVSKLRNRVIGRVFRELGLIEQWGSGMGRMLAESRKHGIQPPRFEELGNHFRVTLSSERVARTRHPVWHEELERYLVETGDVSTKEAARLWKTTDRTARTRLRRLVKEGMLAEVGTGPRDPRRRYVLHRQ